MSTKGDIQNQVPNLSEANPSNPLYGSTAEIMDHYLNCVLCGSHLHFRHFTDFSKNLTQEVAKCPECGIQARHILHRLQ